MTAVVAMSATACSTQTFEERLGHLELLKSRRTISEDEYVIMRRRLVETVDLTTVRPSTDSSGNPAAAEGPAELISPGWVVGMWRGGHIEAGHAFHTEGETVVEFSGLGDQLEWRMTRRFRHTGGVSVAEAAGTAAVLEDVLEMSGAYLPGRSIFSEGTPLGYRLRRTGDSLEGLASGADPLTRTLALHRVQTAAAAPVTPVEPGSLVGVWNGTLLVARRCWPGTMNNPAMLHIFTEASDLRWTLESSYYGEDLTGSGTVIVSADHVTLVGSYGYNAPAGGGGQCGPAAGARDVPIEYIAHVSGNTFRGGGAGLDQLPQSFLLERAGP
jgi:hypothetical protein